METTSVPEMIAAAAMLAPTVREFADEAERGRQCPPKLVEILHEHRMFDMILPEKYGGLEVDMMTMVRVLEELAVADGSTSWVVGIGCGTSIISAYMPETTARDVFRKGVVTGGAMAPNGRATPVDGGFRVSGRWPFASGSTHCSWLVGGTLIFDGDQPRMVSAGMPDWRTMVFPTSEVEIIDTWHVSGLRGTGSRDMAVKDVFVPDDRAIGFMSSKPYVDGPMYRFPILGFLALSIAPIPLGIARRALDELAELAGSKMPMGSMSKLRDRAVTQYELAQAEAKLRSARAWLYELTEEIWDKVVAGDEATMHDRAMLRAACAHAAIESARAVDTAYTLGGGTALYETSVLQRCLRDAHAATQHVMLAPANYEVAGRVLLGLAPSSPMV
ncbi:MAG: acyl-CoA dehydrogenase family protein [Chloroflexota bacterium]|nr:acyl-CoA dehydrogenase family protein [Chloroflexota bacterium]